MVLASSWNFAVATRAETASNARAIRAGNEQAVAGGDNTLGDGRDLIGGLSRAKNDFRHALPERTMMVDTGKAQILEWRLA